jgi:hypothetical protein
MQRSSAALRRLIGTLDIKHQVAVQSLHALDLDIAAARADVDRILGTTPSDIGLGALVTTHSVRKLAALDSQIRKLEFSRQFQLNGTAAAEIRLRRAQDMLKQVLAREEAVALEKSVSEIVEQRLLRRRSSLT